ncbi:UNVERIFIED_CONTAM: hypothetical protein PYX00_001942 [Menopon gallinae]|uniref:Gustatory receptor n=1 Tax=Menopon gallinae TaxID=328185 RepID=A0AAW2IEY6_9NEOP
MNGKSTRSRDEPGRTEDDCYDSLEVDFAAGKFTGLFLFVKNDDGTYSTHYRSLRMLYILVIYVGMSYLWQYTLAEMLTLIRETRVPGAYLLFTLLFVHPIPFVFVAEAKKLNDYLNDWLAYQRRFREITGRKLHLNSPRLKLTVIVVKIFLFLFLISFLRYQFSKISIPSKLLALYYYWVVTVLSSVWYWIIFFLYWTGRAMQDLAASVIRNKSSRVTVAEVEALWVDMSRLVKRIGRTFCFTYCYFILFLFLALTVSTYETLIILDWPITLEKSAFFLLTLTIMIHTASIPFTSQMAVKVIGEDFYKLLLDLKMKERHPPNRVQEIDELLQVISDNRPLIDLGGFVTLDNGLITSLVSTMVTYLIVLVQFKI